MKVVWKNYMEFRKAVYDRSLFFSESFDWHDFKFRVFKSFVESVEEALILGDISKVEELTNMKFEEVLTYIENRKDFKIASLTSEILGSSEKPLQEIVNESLEEIKKDRITISRIELKQGLERAFYQGFTSSTYPGKQEEVVLEILSYLEDDDE